MTESAAPSTVAVATLHRPHGHLGGTQAHFQAFVATARERGIVVDIVSPFQAPMPAVYGLFGAGKLLRSLSRPAHAWWFDRSHGFLLDRMLRRTVARRRPQVIYAQDPISAAAALACRARHRSIEVVLAAHFNISVADEWVGKGSIPDGGRLYQAMMRRDAAILAQVDRLIFVSKYMERAALRWAPGAAQVPRFVIPNSAPVAAATACPALAGDIITIGTLEPRKNQAFLLYVLAQAHRMGHPYRLTIVGDGPLRGELAALANQLDIDGYVTMLGAVDGAASLISAHRVYAHAARMESFGIVLAEALAAGRPVLAAPVGGVPEVFNHDGEGLYWDLDDAMGAARLLISLLEDPDRYARLARAAQRRHAAEFSPAVVMDRLIEAVVGTADASARTS